MTVTVQNLRSFVSGTEPDALLPAQLCFNLVDRIVYVGDGSSTKTPFGGTPTPGAAGQGWYSMPMDFGELESYFVANPAKYGDLPTDTQVLTWSTLLGHPVWTSGGSGGGQVYTTTNSDVASAPGATVSDKIIAAIGVASPDEGDSVIVTGLPGDIYQGLYLFTTQWIRAAYYAYPNAANVTYNNAVSGLSAITVQQAVDELDSLTAVAQGTANTANATANAAQALANAALPKTGGTMTGTITFAAGQTFPVSGIQDASLSQKGVVQGGTNITFPSAGVIDVRGASTTQTGVVQLTDSTTISSSTLAASATAAKSLQSQIDTLSLASNVILAGSLNAATTLVDSVTPDGTAAGFTVASALPAPSAGNADYYVLVSQSGTYSPPGGGGPYTASSGDWFLSNGTTWQYLGVGARPAYATTTSAGIVQLADNPATQTGGSAILAVTPAGLQSKVSDSIATASSTTIASSTAVKTAYDLANAALPKSGGTMTGLLTSLNINVTGTCCVQFNGGVNGNLSGISDSTALTSSITAASSTAVKAAYDIGNAALPKTGGTMTGDITFSGGGTGIVFNNASTVEAISDSTSITSSIIAASSTAVKAAYDLGVAAIPSATVTAKGDLIAGTGPAAYSALPVGSNGYLLVANSGCSTGLEWVANSPNDVTGVTGTAPIQVDNTDAQNPIVSIDAASTTQPGAVQLNDTTSSTSTTEALTANQGYSLQQQVNALAVSNNITLAGTIDGSTGFMLTVTTEGAAQGFSIGSPMPSAVAGNAEYFTIVTVPGTMTPPGGAAQAVNDGDWWLSTGAIWQYLSVGYSAPYASTTVPGVIQLATDAEVQAGVETTHAVVPSSLQSKMSDSTSTTSSTTIASSTAVKSAYDLANAAVPKGCYTALGALVAGTGIGTVGTLALGTNGQSLVVDTACPAGLKWGQSLAGYTCSATPFNTALGTNAGDSITAGTDNVSFGYNAGTAITTGLANTVVGSCAMSVGNAGCITAVGYRAALSATAPGTTAIGFNSLVSLTSGTANTAVGFQAADAVTTGARNTVMGNSAGGSFTTGSDNTVIGAIAATLATGTASTIVGSCAGAALTLGGANVFIGANAGDSVTTGFNNTIIGDVSGSTSLTGNLILAAGTTTKFQANGSGAWSPDGTNYGTAGQVLASQGTGAVPVWCTLSLACIPCSAFTAAGQLLAGTGASTFTALTVGTDGQFLVADSTCTGGLKWATECFINDACYTAKGDILVGTGAGTVSGLTVGTNGQVLTANSACTTGTFWATPLAGYTCNLTPFNTALGVNAGDSITTAVNNTAIGYNAGTANLTGNNNTFVGFAAGDATTSDNNTALGSNALGGGGVNNNTAVGYQAGCSLTTGGSNTFVGAIAGDNATTADGAVAVGYNALGGVATGVGAVAIGLNALAVATSAARTTAVGYASLDALTTGNNNTALGYSALGAVVTGTDNTAVGNDALLATTGSFNTAVGSLAADAIVAGSCNVSIGYSAHGSATAPSQQIAIGASALQSSSSAVGSVGIGHRVGINSTGIITAVGWNALSAMIAGTSTAVGYQAGCAATGAGHTLIGNSAGSAITTGTNNTIIGPYTGTTTLSNNAVIADGSGVIKLQVNENGAVGVSNPPQYGTAGQVLTSSGTGSAPTWVSPAYLPSTATKNVTSGVPVDLLSWASGTRMGTLTVMGVLGTDLIWANITIASTSGIGYSVVTTQAGSFGTFSVTAGGSGETLVTLTPSLSLTGVVFTYLYTASTGSQPTVL